MAELVYACDSKSHGFTAMWVRLPPSAPRQNNMTNLVTGGAGFIGSNLVDKLIELGEKVIVIDDFSAGKEENLEQHKDNKNLKIYRKSICDDLEELFEKEKIDKVFHFAALPRVQFSIQYPKKTHNVNVNGTLNLLLNGKKFCVKRFVFSSSSSTYGDQEKLPLKEDMMPNPISPYGLQKLVGEYYCKIFNKVYGMATISFRYFNVYGPKQDPEGGYALLIPKFIKLIKKDKRPTINGDGSHTRDFTYVGDIVEANLLAANTDKKECFGEIFNIGAGRNISVNDVTKAIIKLSKKDIKPIHGPGVIEPKDTLADTSKAEKMLFWKPKVKFEDGLKACFEDLIKKL